MTNLQDATKLIAELTSKLARLDDKVAAYRLDMAAEFTRHSEELLRSVPEDVAYRVSRAIADQLANYPSLYPPGSLSSSRSATPTNLEDIPWRGKGSPPPIPPQSSGSPKTPDPKPDPFHQRGPHDREQEFHGLFTPTYLPLLESFDRPQHAPGPPHSSPSSPGTPAIADRATLDSQSPVASAQGSHSPHRHRRRPSPLRRATDTSVDSFASDSSSGRVRKSALRRSSGSSKADSPRDHTPRRVRFDFQGQEVLPSSSPQTSTTALNKSDDAREKSALADGTYTTSLGDIEGEEDLPGERPKKVSSTQALRALSKAPLDDGTVWTLVNPGTESQDSAAADKNRKLTAPSPLSQANPEEDEMTLKKVTPVTGVYGQAEAQSEAKDNARDTKINKEIEEDSEDTEEELFMTSKRGPKKKASVTVSAKPTSPVPIERPVSSANPVKFQTAGIADPLKAAEKGLDSKTQNKDSAVKGDFDKQTHKLRGYEDDEEDFFEFDDDTEKSDYVTKPEPSPPKKYLPESHEEEHEEDEKPDRFTAMTNAYSEAIPSSPPINIPVAPRQVAQIPSKVSPKPEDPRAPSPSIGSFVDRDGRKRSLTPGAVRDKELLKKLEKLDVEAPFFVGSVNGNSGVDASNVKSYQASLMSPTQASGSFAERVMWERTQGLTYDSDLDDDKGDKADKGNRNGRR